MSLPRLKIAHRLALSYGAIILLLIATTFVGIGKLKELSATTDDALTDKYPKIILVNQMNADLGIIARAMRNALILNDQDQLRVQISDIKTASGRMANALFQLSHEITDADGQELLRQIRIVNSAYSVNQDDFTELIAEHKMEEARNLLRVDLYGYQNAYFELLDKLNRNQGDLMELSSKEVARTYRTARNVMFALIGAAVLLSVGITFLISRSLLRQLGGEPDYAAAIAREIAAGNLLSRIYIAENDQSSLLFVMAGMRDRLIERDNALHDVNRDLANSIEALKKMQEDLISNEKLAALGALVAGISHELNTPIGNGITAASTLIELTSVFARDAKSGMTRSSLNSYIDNVTEASEILLRNLTRAGDLVLSFKQVAADREASQGRRFILYDLVEEILLMLRPDIKKDPYVVTLDIPKDIVMESYPGPLSQVIINLLNNAMLHGFDGRESGTVSISAIQANADQVEISVADDGKGISPENLKRIYDPFFTTKLGAGSSGLGLHITYNIVTRILAGRIRVVSALNMGTTFIISLPMMVLIKQDECLEDRT